MNAPPQQHTPRQSLADQWTHELEGGWHPKVIEEFRAMAGPAMIFQPGEQRLATVGLPGTLRVFPDGTALWHLQDGTMTALMPGDPLPDALAAALGFDHFPELQPGDDLVAVLAAALGVSHLLPESPPQSVTAARITASLARPHNTRATDNGPGSDEDQSRQAVELAEFAAYVVADLAEIHEDLRVLIQTLSERLGVPLAEGHTPTNPDATPGMGQ